MSDAQIRTRARFRMPSDQIEDIEVPPGFSDPYFEGMKQSLPAGAVSVVFYQRLEGWLQDKSKTTQAWGVSEPITPLESLPEYFYEGLIITKDNYHEETPVLLVMKARDMLKLVSRLLLVGGRLYPMKPSDQLLSQNQSS